jgi:hypothetical protein
MSTGRRSPKESSPVTDPDELLARVDQWDEEPEALVAELAAALRLALATQPQPRDHGIEIVLAHGNGCEGCQQVKRIALSAVAGSATPTHPWARDNRAEANGWAGSATPTRDDDDG